MARKDDGRNAKRLVSQFVSASVPLEKYLMDGGALTDSELRSIALTMSALQIFINGWKQKRGIRHLPRFS
ncbi:hypothetical protein W02_03700 [Nitrospira sp. KM1]|uniref:hypothetical protein n=1 Tax=Nitrospira sp. KM1 TaxID=1936990 RepID=UPI0013A79B3A|nr:hypothetical protein [Nitrospira sp. KM1]BCA53230.1 hypothetical protein W02_03700 [Nitrospira sp. KM1]